MIGVGKRGASSGGLKAGGESETDRAGGAGSEREGNTTLIYKQCSNKERVKKV